MSGTTPPPEALKGARKGISKAVVVIVAIAAFVAGMGAASLIYPAKTTAAEKTYIIGTNTPFPPFESLDANETIVGFDIDLITTIMHNAGKQVAVRDFRDFSALLSSVQTHRVDIAVSAITSSGATGATRNATMSFSDPYFVSNQAVLIRVGYNATTCQPDPTGCVGSDLTGKKIAVQAGTSSEFWVSDNVASGPPVTTFPDVTQVLEALRTSSVDIVVIDKPAGDGIVAANPSTYVLLGTVHTNELYSFAVPKGDPDHLLPVINGQLTAMKADGSYNTILHKWF